MRRLSCGVAPLLLAVVGICHVQGRASDLYQNSRIAIEFEGNKVFPTRQLLDVTSRCVAQGPESQKGYNPDLYDYCLRHTLANFIRSKGYLRAVVGEERRQQTAEGLKIVVPVDEGALYRLGDIRIEGSKVFSPGQLREMLEIKSGDIAAGTAIYEWLAERVGRAYGDRGYIQYQFELEPDFQPAPDAEGEGLVDFEVTIGEGRLFTVRRIEFVGNEHTSEVVLRRALLIEEDEPFSQQRFDESIRRLNELGLFEKIDEGKDVDFRSDDESSRLDLTIRLREKDKQ